MAALYLHNAFWSGRSSNSRNSPHTRQLSNISNHTLRTVTSESSCHPTEPLLVSTTSESLAYQDLLSRQPTHPSGPQPGWDLGFNFEGDQTTMQERKGHRDQGVRRRIKRLRLAKGVLELVMGGWAVYNLIRYFQAYFIYTSPTGRAVSLALATGTTLSLAFLMATALLSCFRESLLMHQVPLSFLLIIRTTLQFLASFLLVGPALVSFGLVFAWRDSSDSQLQLQNRCYLDIDVVWSIWDTSCDQTISWNVLLILSITRVILTVLNILFYHLLSREYHHTRRPSRTKSSKTRPHLSPLKSPKLGRGVPAPPSPLLPTVGSGSPNIPHLTPPQPAALPPTWMINNPTGEQLAISRTRSRPPVSRSSSGSTIGSRDRVVESDSTRPRSIRTLSDEFIEDYGTLVNRLSREIESANIVATPNRYSTSSSSSSSSSTCPSAYCYRPASADSMYQPSYPNRNPFQSPEPDVHVLVLGGIVRRMPTIESVGSRELGSISPSSQRHETGAASSSLRSFETASAPPTRTNTRSTIGSSRANSMYTNAGHLLAVNERVDQVLSEGADLSHSRDGSVADSAEGTFTSYHTAGSSSASSPTRS